MLHGHTVPEPHQDVVGFDVSMKDVAALEEFEGQEELLAVRAHCLDVEPHIFTILLQDLPQVHTRTGSYVYVTFIHYWETKSHRSSKFLKGLPFLSNFFLKNYCLPYIVINCLPYLFVGKSVAASMIDTL